MKDAKGHGSNNKLAPNAAAQSAGLRRSFQALYGNTGGSMASRSAPGDRTLGGYDQGSGSSVTMGGHGGDWGNEQAAQQLASGPKSAPVATHDSMSYADIRDPDDLRTS